MPTSYAWPFYLYRITKHVWDIHQTGSTAAQEKQSLRTTGRPRMSWIFRADSDATRSRSYTSSWPTTPAAERLLRLTLDKEIPEILERK
ncbi:hypothetical protein Bpfe_027604, partial [Biomphalaria pfeifferi]